MPDSPFYHYASTFDAIAEIQSHAAEDLQPDPDHLVNFLGVKISPRFFPGILDGKGGQIEPIPIPANWHADIAEWAFALKAVSAARSTFRVVELGCGWGCWLNNTGVAARRRGLLVDLIGIEGDAGDAGHVQFAHESLAANGFKETEYRVTHGIAGPISGKALFPVVENPGGTWGSEPVFGASEAQLVEAQRTGHYDVLDTYPLSVLSDNKQIDLLHIDIQGGETDFVIANFDDINRYVSRMLIGTHSRSIEGDIMRFMLEKGWTLEMDRSCIFGLPEGRPVIHVDGVQGWVNPKHR